MASELRQRLLDAQEIEERLRADKIRKEEQLKNEQNKLNEIVAKIKDKGYDPKTLPATIEAKKKELLERLEQFEKEAAQAEAQLNQLSTV